MGGSTQNRFGRQVKLSATLLGLVALVVAGLVVQVTDLPSPWAFVAFLATAVAVLVLGTRWLVPRSSSDA